MQPLELEPIIKQIRWGGRRLGEQLGKPIGDEANYAESWEVANHENGQSVVAAGDCQGEQLGHLVQAKSAELFGRHGALEQFPLLIKFLDANDWLSLQVHPNDVQAKQFDPTENGKTEAWIIIDAEPGSKICAGLKDEVTRESFSEHLRNGTVEECLNIFEAKPGDCVFVRAGTVHAIGAGILLAEVQQMSNITFRLHDWGKLGSDGKPREIHIEQSLACTDFERGPVMPVTPAVLSDGDHRHEELVRSEYFVIQRHQTSNAFDVNVDNKFHIVMVLDGAAELQTAHYSRAMTRGSTALVPASVNSFRIAPTDAATVLDVFLP